ncbi:MAG: transcriptional regulator, LysR family [Ramlibacter sp.]|nr:transcriptional regulator, LysR family [Ramlibacter sp.]
MHSFLCVGPVVASSDLIGVVPSNLAAVVAGHVPLQLVEPPVQFPDFDITMAWHHRFNLDPGNTWLRGVLMSPFDGLKVEPPGARAAASSRKLT